MIIERVNILYDNKVIDSEVRDYLLNVIDTSEEIYGRKFSEENASMLITHFAMAICRVKSDSQLVDYDAVIEEELINSENASKAEEILKMIEKSNNIIFNKSEMVYMLLHICSFLSKADHI